jgi:hypothetical protein
MQGAEPVTTVCKICRQIIQPSVIQTGADVPQVAGAADLFAYGEAAQAITNHLMQRHPEVYGPVVNAAQQYAVAVACKFAEPIAENKFTEQWEMQARFIFWTLAGTVKTEHLATPTPPQPPLVA